MYSVIENEKVPFTVCNNVIITRETTIRIIRKTTYHAKLKAFCSFVNNFSPIMYIFQNATLTFLFETRWRCKSFHSLAYCYFIISRQHTHDYSYPIMKLKVVGKALIVTSF